MTLHQPPTRPRRPRGTRTAARTTGRAAAGKPLSVTARHAEWIRLVRPDGPFIALPVLAGVFAQGLDTVPDDTLDKLRLAWAEVQAAPDLLNPAWCQLVLTGLLGYTPVALAEGGALPADLLSGPASKPRPDAVAYGPDGVGGRAERLLIYRLPWDTPLTRATRDQPSPAEQAADLCRHRGIPLALLTNGALWALVHARPDETTTTAVFDADLWLEERDLLRAFASLLNARRVLPPPKLASGEHSANLAALFARSAEAQAEVTNTLGVQVRQAVELLVGELSRLNRESAGAVLGEVKPRMVYRGALTVMMRLVFLLYAEEQRLLPVASDLYASAYSVTNLHDQLDAEQNLYGEEVGDRRAAAWPRLLATFTAIYGGCEHDAMRIPPYGGSMFDPGRYPWLEHLPVTDRVVHEILGALLILRRRGGAAERLSYKGLDVEQIGHVYEGLLEFSCLRVEEPYLGLMGKNEAEVPLAEVEQAAAEAAGDMEAFAGWLADVCGPSVIAVRKALASAPSDAAALHAACDNDVALADRVWALRGLLRTDLRGLPTVFPSGSLIVTQVGDRRATGTHYTPRALAEEIVEHTLAPLCYSPGPADGAEPGEWQPRPAGELLSLKILDPAMGSGAFLVAACRYLADLIVTSWERDGYPDPVLAALGPDFDRDDALLEAKRRVAARCLCGVDKDEAAVELGKLSLWLVTLSKDKPFSFLDHALRCGDSLVGLISGSQVEAFHLDPETGRRINARLSGAIDEVIGPILTQVRELREEIAAEPVRDAHQADVLAAKLRRTERLTARLRYVADAVSAAALASAGQPEEAFNNRLTGLEEWIRRLLADNPLASPLELKFRETLDSWLRGSRAEPIRPLHWALEFPEVMRRGGFDGVVSNPPFMGGSKISGALGADYREYLKQRLAADKTGNADLCAYFLLRYLAVAQSGRVGIIATNTIAEGDTREVGLDQALDLGWVIYRADKSQPWPGTASLEVSLVWMGHVIAQEVRVLDGTPASDITPSLDQTSRVSGRPRRLAVNSGHVFEGSKITGMGFVLSIGEAQTLIMQESRNKDVLFPYLNGEDLNSRWDCSASRWVINFHDWPLERAMNYDAPFAIINEKVRPVREKNNRKVRRERWWHYGERAPGLYKAVADLKEVIAVVLVSKYFTPVLVPTGQVFAHRLAIFPLARSAYFALLSSAMNQHWAFLYSSTLENRLNYSPSDAFDTFPQPSLTAKMDSSAQDLNLFRHNLMRRWNIGLTELYNLIHDPASWADEVSRLRESHVKIDEAVLEAYALDEEREPASREFEARIATAPLPAWREIDLGHGFHETRQGVRFTISPQARVDVLDKLLALNHYRYQQEVERGLHSGNGRGGPRKKGARWADPASGFDDGLLFPLDEATF